MAQIMPAAFERRMRAIAASGLDPEERRRLADTLIAETLRSLGYGDGVDALAAITAPPPPIDTSPAAAAAQAVERARTSSAP